MNRDTVVGSWKQIKGKAHVRWSMLIGDPLGMISGRHTQYDGERQSAYGAIHSKSLSAARKHAPRLISLKHTTVGDLSRTAQVQTMHAYKTH